MIIQKTVICQNPKDETQDMDIPEVGETFVNYPVAAKSFAECLVSALAELDVEMTYDEQSSKISVNGCELYLIYGYNELNVFCVGVEGKCGGFSPQANRIIDSKVSQELTICVRGTPESFEVLVGDQHFFGIYTVERLYDNEHLTAIRNGYVLGELVIYKEGTFVEKTGIVFPNRNEISKYKAYGVALVPAICTNFVYTVVNAFMLIPFLQEGASYDMGDVSVISAASCVLIVV